ncbi:MAG: hypothetical protein MJK04_37640, partial [Psychrosphaera sp.]|nr:hypothetical protein [Psychrosphaera sp.]
TPRFFSLWVDDGLPNNSVISMVQDPQGFIWLGTFNGLARYDGYQFKNFFATGLTGALSDDYIRAMRIDVNGTLWVATHRGGLNRFDKNRQTFAHYQHDSNDSNSLSANSVRYISDNGDGTLWIGTSQGLDLFDSQNGVVLNHYASAPVRALLKPVDGKLWVATEAGVYRFDSEPASGSEHFTVVDLPGLASPSSRALLRDDQGNIWIATTQGLFKYHHTTGQVTAFEQGLKSPARILSLTRGLAGSVWVGSTLQGLYHIDADNTVKQYRYDKSHQFSLADNAVISMMTDAGGVLWAGTFNAGVSRLSVNSLAFGLFNDSVDSVSCLPNAAIYSIYGQSVAQHAGSILLGTDSGLVQIDNNGDCKVYGTDNVKAIYVDHQQQLWLGLGPGKGLAKYDGLNDRFNRVDNALSQENINFIIQDNQQRLLVATKKDLYVQDPVSQDFTLVNVADPQWQQSDLFVGKKDKQGTLWLGTNKGLAYFDAQQHTLVAWNVAGVGADTGGD